MSRGHKMQVKPGWAKPWYFPSLSITPISALGMHWKQQAMFLDSVGRDKREDREWARAGKHKDVIFEIEQRGMKDTDLVVVTGSRRDTSQTYSGGNSLRQRCSNGRSGKI